MNEAQFELNKILYSMAWIKSKRNESCNIALKIGFMPYFFSVFIV
jgi:hypothetical protein